MTSRLEELLGKEDFSFLRQIRGTMMDDDIPGIELFNGDKIFGKRLKFNDRYTKLFEENGAEFRELGLEEQFLGTFYDALNFYHHENCNTHPKRTQLLRKGDVFLDVGCRSGHLAIKASRAVGPTGHVYCVDATDAAEQAVSRHIRSNNLENVTFLKSLIGNEVSEAAKFFVGSDNETYSGIFETTYDDSAEQIATKEHHKSFVQLPMHTIDSLKAKFGIKKVDVISLQINGAEAFALEGAHETLQKDRPIIYATTFQNATQGANIKEEFRSILGGIGYQCHSEVAKEMIFV